MTTGKSDSATTRRIASDRQRLVRRLVDAVGGRFTSELGIGVDDDDREVERWFLAATLFGTRIPSAIAERTYRVLAQAGIDTVGDVHGRTWEELVELLDRGGYARYDYRTATRLQQLATAVEQRHSGRIARLGEVRDPATLTALLDELPGWGPVTVNLFLRELRGVWPGAAPPLDERAAWSLDHLRLAGRGRPSLRHVTDLARDADIDPRDLEAALVRLALRHRRTRSCPGGARCAVVSSCAGPNGA